MNVKAISTTHQRSQKNASFTGEKLVKLDENRPSKVRLP